MPCLLLGMARRKAACGFVGGQWNCVRFHEFHQEQPCCRGLEAPPGGTGKSCGLITLSMQPRKQKGHSVSVRRNWCPPSGVSQPSGAPRAWPAGALGMAGEALHAGKQGQMCAAACLLSPPCLVLLPPPAVARKGLTRRLPFPGGSCSTLKKGVWGFFLLLFFSVKAPVHAPSLNSHTLTQKGIE